MLLSFLRRLHNRRNIWKTTFRGDGMYFYNKNTGALHIDGHCQHSKEQLANIMCFKTERDAYDFAGQKIFLCKVCQKTRDRKMGGVEK